ncbi:site-specific DNA-methyltransferase [Alphaproteobacteria bacterium]|nr:site-specific DNA-methyltransferase [Alphaproteobacteria bacterium]
MTSRLEIIGDATLYLGDCEEVMPTLGTASVDLILTDPPYKVEMHGRGLGKRKIYGDSGEWSNIDLNLFGGDAIMDEWLRLCKFPNIFSFCDKRELRDLMNQAHKRGLQYAPVPLCKTNPMPFARNWLGKEEGVHIYDRFLGYNKDTADKMPYFLISVGGVKDSPHPNVKPGAVLRSILRNLSLPGHTIFDPYMGSGSTGIAALRLGRKFAGIERTQKWFDESCRRMDAIVKQQSLPFGGEAAA